MKWNNIVAKAIKDGASAKLLEETICEMQDVINCVRDMEPDVYWRLKSAVLAAVNGSANDCYGMDDDSYNII